MLGCMRAATRLAGPASGQDARARLRKIVESFTEAPTTDVLEARGVARD